MSYHKSNREECKLGSKNENIILCSLKKKKYTGIHFQDDLSTEKYKIPVKEILRIRRGLYSVD